MDQLLAHPGFRLIHVDQNGFMSLVTPLIDGCKEDILENGYRCISHYWGPKPPKWEDHPVTGVEWGVHVREEKRTRLLQIFSHHKGYFWMDVFCTNQDDDNKPLDVMGDIYRDCIECVCMLDIMCDVDGFISEKELLRDMARDMKKYSSCHPGIMRMMLLQLERGSSLINYATSMEKHEIYLSGIATAKWFKRVWTWQEAILPPKLLFCSERAGTYVYDPFDHEFLRKLFPYKLLGKIIEDVGNTRMCDEWTRWGITIDNGSQTESSEILSYLLPLMRLRVKEFDIWDNIRIAADSERKCTNKKDFVYGITGVLNLSVPKGLELDDAMTELEKELQKQGIFIAWNPNMSPNGSWALTDTLSELYTNRRLVDGIVVSGRGDDVTTLGKFNPGVGVLNCREHGRIITKIYPWECRQTHHTYYKYETETLAIFLDTDCYNIGDIAETTTIGRKNCTFENQGKLYKNEIFRIVGSRVAVVGFIVDRNSKGECDE